MYCIKCGKEQAEGLNYCQNCGQLLHENVSQVKSDEVPTNLWKDYTKYWKNYAVYEGVATRREYWSAVLFNLLISIAISAVTFYNFISLSIASSLWLLATVLPSLFIAIRRLRDVGQSVWWIFLALLPVIGWGVLIYFYCQPTKNKSQEKQKEIQKEEQGDASIIQNSTETNANAIATGIDTDKQSKTLKTIALCEKIFIGITIGALIASIFLLIWALLWGDVSSYIYKNEIRSSFMGWWDILVLNVTVSSLFFVSSATALTMSSILTHYKRKSFLYLTIPLFCGAALGLLVSIVGIW